MAPRVRPSTTLRWANIATMSTGTTAMRTRHQQVVSGAGELPLEHRQSLGDHHQVLAVRHHQREQEVVPVLQYGVPEDVAEDRTRSMADGLLVGTPEQVTERLKEVSGLGMSYAILNFAEVAYDRTSLNLFTEKVLPALA
jgi:alkanesulfonate monooxygenase SsuD/methylene tetrahydromethanopterin reductase-like flavin-dependent oxidoreductase (luciferase family)